MVVRVPITRDVAASLIDLSPLNVIAVGAAFFTPVIVTEMTCVVPSAAAAVKLSVVVAPLPRA